MQQRNPLSNITADMLSPLLPSDTSVVDIHVALGELEQDRMYTLEELVVAVNKATEDRVHATQP